LRKGEHSDVDSELYLEITRGFYYAGYHKRNMRDAEEQVLNAEKCLR